MDLIIDFDLNSDKRRLYDILKGFTGKKLVKIEKYRKKRSLNENRYYHGVVLRYISEATGFTGEEAHEVCKNRFLVYKKADKLNGEEFSVTKSTTELNTLEFEEYLEKIRMWALDFLDCLIPLPNEVIH